MQQKSLTFSTKMVHMILLGILIVDCAFMCQEVETFSFNFHQDKQNNISDH